MKSDGKSVVSLDENDIYGSAEHPQRATQTKYEVLISEALPLRDQTDLLSSFRRWRGDDGCCHRHLRRRKTKQKAGAGMRRR